MSGQAGLRAAPADTTGRELFVGATDVVVTSAVGAEVATAPPAEFEADTDASRELPTSAALAKYVIDVAPEIGRHPLDEQRNHWYAYAVGEPVHEPLEAVNVWPDSAEPDTTGGDELVGTDVVTGEPRMSATALASVDATVGDLLTPGDRVGRSEQSALNLDGCRRRVSGQHETDNPRDCRGRHRCSTDHEIAARRSRRSLRASRAATSTHEPKSE